MIASLPVDQKLWDFFAFHTSCQINKSCKAAAKWAWKSNGTGLMVCRLAFSINRFGFLLQSFQFDNINTRVGNDKLTAAREIYSSLNQNYQDNYNLSEFVTIDEILHPFWRLCSFVMYMPINPAKYGLKMYALCDVKWNLLWNPTPKTYFSLKQDNSCWQTFH